MPTRDARIAPTQRSAVIVADGDPGAREALLRILEPSHRVRTAACWDALCEQLERERADAVLFDVRLPGQTRGAAVAALRSAHPDVAWLALAGDLDLRGARELLAAGVAELLEKPFDVVELCQAVDRALLARRQRGQLVSFLRALGRLAGEDRRVSQILEVIEEDAPLRGQAGKLLAWTAQRMVKVNRSREADAIRGEGSAPGSVRTTAASAGALR